MDLSKTAHRFRTRVVSGDDASRAMTVLLRKLAGFAGLVHENMYHAVGWRFLEIGRRLERAIEMCRLMALLAPPDAAAELLDLLVEVGDSVMTHRRRYKLNSGRLAAIELLALDEFNPRSIRYQLAEVKAQVALAHRRRERRSHPSHHARGAAPLHRAAVERAQGLLAEAPRPRWPLRSPRCPT